MLVTPKRNLDPFLIPLSRLFDFFVFLPVLSIVLPLLPGTNKINIKIHALCLFILVKFTTALSFVLSSSPLLLFFAYFPLCAPHHHSLTHPSSL